LIGILDNSILRQHDPAGFRLLHGRIDTMRTLACSVVIAFLLMIGGTTYGYNAGDDIDPANLPAGFNWANMGNTTDYYMDAAGKVQQGVVKGFQATGALLAAHASTHLGNKIAHWHAEKGFGAGYIAVADVNKYWDVRFSGATFVSNATNISNCHIYAFTAGITAGGAYVYWIDNPTTAYLDDTTAKAANQVVANDLLRYGVQDHSTVVTAVAANKPTNITWKFNSSGVYTYTVKVGTEYDTPMCTGAAVIGAVPAGWAWSESGGGLNGNVYHTK
jgi:hypothetical protein